MTCMWLEQSEKLEKFPTRNEDSYPQKGGSAYFEYDDIIVMKFRVH